MHNAYMYYGTKFAIHMALEVPVRCFLEEESAVRSEVRGGEGAKGAAPLHPGSSTTGSWPTPCVLRLSFSA